MEGGILVCIFAMLMLQAEGSTTIIPSPVVSSTVSILCYVPSLNSSSISSAGPNVNSSIVNGTTLPICATVSMTPTTSAAGGEGSAERNGSGGVTPTATSGAGGVGATTTPGAGGITLTATSGAGGVGATTTSGASGGGGSGGGGGGATATSGASGISPTTASSVVVTATTSAGSNGNDTVVTVRLDDAEVTMKLTLQGNFTADLNDPTSKDFIAKKKEVEDAVCAIIRAKLKGIKRCEVVGFRAGSIVAVLNVTLDQNVANIPSNISYTTIFTNAILQANASGNLGGLQVSALQVSEFVPPPPTTAKPTNTSVHDDDDGDDDGLKGWQIALIVIFVLILIGIIVFIVFLVVYKKKTEPAKEMEDRCSSDNEVIGITNPTVYEEIAEDKV